LSVHVPRRHAAITPVMIPSTIEKIVPSATIGIVFFSGSQSVCQTGSWVRSERPMSPWARPST
jgi:hypothetical protein